MTQNNVIRMGLGLLLFGLAYAILNQHLLTQSILYRAAANDYDTAVTATASFAIQSLLLLLAIVLLPGRWFGLAMIFLATSSAVNVGYGQLLNDVIDLHKISWMLTEVRQAANAAGEFALPVFIAFCKFAVAILFLFGARKAMREPVCRSISARFSGKIRASFPLIVLLVAPSVIWPATGFGPEAAERNVYGYVAKLAAADPPPARGAVTVEPQNEILANKIIWLIDESVSHEIFSEIVKPTIKARVLDFGEVASMGNCSTPANVALRSGVNVREIDKKTDLRTTPSIWGYARKAGYKTLLIDGQVAGPPQNLLLAPERELIDSYQAMKGDLRTDFKIARRLNKLLKSDGKKFAFVLLRGVHFQYSDHFPENALPANSSTMAQYKEAVAYSKLDFYAELLGGVDRSEIAIFYTSDHGQNIEPGVLPHCSTQPFKAEFSVPLLAFLSSDAERLYTSVKTGERSASQIFPTSLQLMGYPDSYARENYDNDLKLPTAQYVWFGRGIFPVSEGSSIELHKPRDFPGR